MESQVRSRVASPKSQVQGRKSIGLSTFDFGLLSISDIAFFVRKEVSASLEETDKTLQSIDRLFTPDFDTIRLLLQGGTVFAGPCCKESKEES